MKKTSLFWLVTLPFFLSVANAYTIMDQKNVNWWEFTWGEIVQERPSSLSDDDWPQWFIMMDRNLWATSNDIYNRNSYGYHYQRWNNYGFSIGCFEKSDNGVLWWCWDWVTSSATDVPAKYKDEYFHKWYVWKTFVKLIKDIPETDTNRDYWENNMHYWWLWWWENDYYYFGDDWDLWVNLSDQSKKYRQGPCPDWWHIPSIWEWAKLTKYWAVEYEEKNKTKLDFTDKYEVYQIFEWAATDDFIKKFKLPLAWERYEGNASILHWMWNYWSSSVFWKDKVTDAEDHYAYMVNLETTWEDGDGLISNSNGSPRSRWASVRCFKNEYKKAETQQTSTTTNTSTTQSNAEDWFDNWDQSQMLSNGFTREYNNAYKFAYQNRITTTTSIESANMKWELTRIAMAKMLSNYAIKVLWKTPDYTKSCAFSDVTTEQNAKYDNGVLLSCQLWIMWVGISNFRPYESVTRAQFGSALSRMLYWIADGSPDYYSTHLNRLNAEWIMKNPDPKKKESRWNVMLMLMRSALSVDDINKHAENIAQAEQEKANKKVSLITKEWMFKWYPEFDLNYWSSTEWVKTCKDDNGMLFFTDREWFLYLYEDENWKHTCTYKECIDDKWNIEKLLYNEEVKYGWDDVSPRRFSCTQNNFYISRSRSSAHYEYHETAWLFHNNLNDRILYKDKNDNLYWYLWVVDLFADSSKIDSWNGTLYKIEQWFNKDKYLSQLYIAAYVNDLAEVFDKEWDTDRNLYSWIINMPNKQEWAVSYTDILLNIIDKYLNQLKDIEESLDMDFTTNSSYTKLKKMKEYYETLKQDLKDWKKIAEEIDKLLTSVKVSNWTYTFPENWRSDIEKQYKLLVKKARDHKSVFNTYQTYLINYTKEYLKNM